VSLIREGTYKEASRRKFRRGGKPCNAENFGHKEKGVRNQEGISRNWCNGFEANLVIQRNSQADPQGVKTNRIAGEAVLGGFVGV